MRTATMTLEDEMEMETTACDACEAETPNDDIDDDGLCPACAALAAKHRYRCDECGYDIDDREEARHAEHTDCCESCGEARVLNDAKDKLDTLVESLKGTDDLEAIRKAVRALKRIVK